MAIDSDSKRCTYSTTSFSISLVEYIAVGYFSQEVRPNFAGGGGVISLREYFIKLDNYALKLNKFVTGPGKPCMSLRINKSAVVMRQDTLQ